MTSPLHELWRAQPAFVLSPDKRRYIAQNGDTPTTVAEPGAEDRILKVASAYEAASKRRVPPPTYPALRESS